ncbi:MAG TPA: DUF5668 domain-containing protein [Thermoanaerobaculia bacterium]|jgi:hypothetical protein
MNRKIDSGALGAGFVLVTIGVLMLVDRFSALDFGYVIRHFWPLVLILVGVPKLVHRATIWNGLWLIFIGTWLQLIQLRVFGMTYRNSWPLLLIAIGGGMIVRAMLDVALPAEERHEQRR